MLLIIAATILTILFIIVVLKLSTPETRSKPSELGILATKIKGAYQSLAAQSKAKRHSAKKGCIHGLGYLSKLPKSAQVPDECFGCQRMADCLMSKGVSEKVKGEKPCRSKSKT